MLKNERGNGYKALARLATCNSCHVLSWPYECIVVDIRSCLFRYMRKVYTERSIAQKIMSVFRVFIHGVKAEMIKVLEDAIDFIKREVALLSVKKAYYVLCSPTRCRYREGLKILYRIDTKHDARINLDTKISEYRKNVLSLEAILSCQLAIDTYIITHVEDVCLMYTQVSGLSANYIQPGLDNFYESDRLCARLSASEQAAILSEDFDCIALFGAKLIVTDVDQNVINYVLLQDVLNVFKSPDRENLVYKCIIMGTDYNLGIKGIGPAKIVKIEVNEVQLLAADCMASQSIDIDEFKQFFFVLQGIESIQSS